MLINLLQVRAGDPKKKRNADKQSYWGHNERYKGRICGAPRLLVCNDLHVLLDGAGSVLLGVELEGLLLAGLAPVLLVGAPFDLLVRGLAV